MSDEPFQRSCRPESGSWLLSLLERMLDQLPSGSVALLRPLPSDFDPRRDDVDLLLADATRIALLQILAAEAGRTCCSEETRPDDSGELAFHFRVLQVRPEKICLTIWDLDGRSSLRVDLWSEFRQLSKRTSIGIPAEILLARRARAGEPYERRGIPLLCPDIHFCLLVLHLASKRRSLSSSVTRERLTQAFERLKSWAIDGTSDLSPLLTLAESLLNARSLSPSVIRCAETYLVERVHFSMCPNCSGSCDPIAAECNSDRQEFACRVRKSDGFRYCRILKFPRQTQRISGFIDKARSEICRWWMKQVRCAAIDGSDGAGKTTLIRCLCNSADQPVKPVVAKKLYRRSWTYQIVHSAFKHLTGLDRCTIDDHLALFTTLRAAIQLWFLFAWSALRNRFAARTTLLLDRSVASFLIRNRKCRSLSLTPVWWLMLRFVPPMTTILLRVPWSILKVRKQEMTEASHDLYESRLWLLATRHRPFDVIVFNNTLASDRAAECLLRMLALTTMLPGEVFAAGPQVQRSSEEVAA